MAEDSPDTTRAEALATEAGALDLNMLSLIGTMGTDEDRRALVRLPTGRFQTIAVGDMLRGRRVDAIEPGRLLMSRNGHQSVLEMPRG